MLCTKVKYCMSNNQTIVGYFLQSFSANSFDLEHQMAVLVSGERK